MPSKREENAAELEARNVIAGHKKRTLIVRNFLEMLIAQDEICDPAIFTILTREADKLGYKLCASQWGTNQVNFYFDPKG